MNKRLFCDRINRLIAVLLVPVSLVLGACASNKAGMKSPELPARHWLVEAPGVPVENKEKLDAAIPNLYDPDKSFDYEDCVYLTIQQSPMLVNSAVDIEIKKLAVTDAVWKYLPEPRLMVTITNNITQLNNDSKDTPGNYGRPMVRVGFEANIPNPVRSYFEHKVQNILLNMAISTHRKAVAQAIYNIAAAYLNLQAQREILKAQQELIPLSRQLSSYWHQVENVEGRQGVELDLARQGERERELTIEKTTMQEVMDRTRLKILAGVNPTQKFNINTDNANDILAGFDGSKLKWEDRWNQTEDDLLLRTQIKLSDYNIMLAWAQYVPNMNFSINNYPPAGQSNPPSGKEDTFVHLSFDFPLLDWGRRYRGVQTARMQKAQAFHEMANKRNDFSNKWLEAEQGCALAQTEYKLQKNRFETAEMQYNEAKISFNEGIVELPLVISTREAMISARISLIKADLEYKLAQLKWMDVANLLAERFLGPPARDIM